MPRPTTDTYSPFMEGYIGETKGETIPELIANHHQELLDFYGSLPEDKADYAYATGKWTVKEVLSHVIDTDAVFFYRALALSRGETQTLPGFDQDQYADNAEATSQSLAALKGIFAAQRTFIQSAIVSFSETQLSRIGAGIRLPPKCQRGLLCPVRTRTAP
ncbi:MAG: DinB family protein [Chitinophagaceae bacterium]